MWKPLGKIKGAGQTYDDLLGDLLQVYNPRELAEIILKLTNSKSKVIIIPKISHDVLERIPNIIKIKNKLGWVPKTSLKVGLKKMLESHIILKN